jgi:hypothetical protein
MINRRMLVGGIAGALIYFSLGWVADNLFLDNFLSAHQGLAMQTERPGLMHTYSILSALISGFMLSFVLTRINSRSVSRSVIYGAFLGFCVKAGVYFHMYAHTTVFSRSGILAETLTFSLLSGIAAIAICMAAGVEGVSASYEYELPKIEMMPEAEVEARY